MAEVTNQERLRFFEDLVGAVGVVVWQYDWESDAFTFVSAATEGLLGYPRDEWLRPKFWVDHLHPDDRLWAPEHCLKATQEGRDHSFEYRMIHRDGSIRWIHDIASVDPVKRTSAPLHGIIFDITDRMARDDELRQSREIYSTLVEMSPYAIYVTDMEDRIVFANDAAAEMLGASDKSQLIGVNAAERLHTGCAALAHAQDVVAHASETRSEPCVCEMSTLDGRMVNVERTVEPIVFRGETAVLSLAKDITKRVEGERRAREYKERLSELAVQLTEIEGHERRRLAEELHDRVGQALAVARMRLASAASSTPANASDLEEGLVFLDEAIRETRQITTRLFPPVLAELGLCAGLEWLCDDIGRTYHLDAKCDSCEEPLVEERTQLLLFRSARELLLNVVKHANADHASVALLVSPNRIELIVEDDGCGFDVSSHSDDGTFSGFGLFSIRDRVTRAGGSFHIESAPGQGARVSLELPLEG